MPTTRRRSKLANRDLLQGSTTEITSKLTNPQQKGVSRSNFFGTHSKRVTDEDVQQENRDFFHRGRHGSTYHETYSKYYTQTGAIKAVSKNLYRNFTSAFTILNSVFVAALWITALIISFLKLGNGNLLRLTNNEAALIRMSQLYANGTFFMFSEPPLVPQLLFLLNCTATVKEVDDISVIIRATSAVFGGAAVAVVYLICCYLTSERLISFLGTTLVFFENSFGLQDCFYLTETLNTFFLLLSLLAYLAQENSRSSSNSKKTACNRTLIFSALCFAVAVCLKFSSVMLCLAMLGIVLRDAYNLLDDKRIPLENVAWKFVFRLLIYIVVPLVAYLLVIWHHFYLVPNYGPDAARFSSVLQASLQGRYSEFAASQPSFIMSGSRVTLRNSDFSTPCWLHSGEHLYPVNYEDGRGSSHQQIVRDHPRITCHQQKTANNWWFIAVDDDAVGGRNQPIKAGDEVRLIHGVTRRLLNSHDVAGPLSPRSQEVSCYVDFNISMPVEPNWKLLILNAKSEEEKWAPVTSRVQLIHVTTGQSLRMTGKRLPDWADNTLEVIADSEEGGLNVWNVEEHRIGSDKNSREKSSVEPNVQYLSYWTKFLELHQKLLATTWSENGDQRLFEFGWIKWVLGVPVEVLFVTNNSKSSVQLYESQFLIPNFVLHYGLCVGACLFGIFVFTVSIMERRKMLKDTNDQVFLAAKTVGLGLFTCCLTPLLFDRGIIAEESGLMLKMELILSVVLLDGLYTRGLKKICFSSRWLFTLLSAVLITWLLFLSGFVLCVYGVTNNMENLTKDYNVCSIFSYWNYEF